MKEKVLVLASVASMIDQFNIPNIELLQSLDYEVHVACNFEKGSTCSQEKITELKRKLKEMNVKIYQIDFTRSVFNIKQDIVAYKQVKNIMVENNYKFIHCHSPIGGVVGRLTCRATKIKCIYTAHGFHFYKGAPLKNWILFYPIEKWLSKYTDVLITINKEDYERACRKFKSFSNVQIPGIGVDTQKYADCEIDRISYREKLGVDNTDVLILSIGELNDRKNHSTIIKALSKINMKQVKYLIAGIGENEEKLKKLSLELCVSDQVRLLGYRTDTPQLLKCADIFAFPSKREGLGIAAIEAMAAGVPIVTSNVNGINDYSINCVTGYSCSPENVDLFSEALIKLVINKEKRIKIGKGNINRAKAYDLKNVNMIMLQIYQNI